MDWQAASKTVIAGGKGVQGGWMSVADQKLIARIISEDGTWHRPFTTLELAALQGLIDPEEQLELDGLSDGAWRERIGNAVPPPAAEAIANTMYHTLLLARTGSRFAITGTPIWVRQIGVALSAPINGAEI